MTCEQCQRISESFSEKPFCLIEGHPYGLPLYDCECGAKWWQFNTIHHLWKEISEETFLALQDDPYAIVDAGSGKVIGRGSDFA